MVYRILDLSEIVMKGDEVENQTQEQEQEQEKWNTLHNYEGMVVSECRCGITKRQRTFRRKVEEPMFFRVSDKSDLHAGEIVKLVENVRITTLRVKTQEGKTMIAYFEYLTPIQVKVTKTLVSPASKLIKILEDDGYTIDRDGCWVKRNNPSFGGSMTKFIGKELPSNYDSNPNWFEEKWEEIKPEVNYKKFVVDFMKLKRGLSHPAYLYERDIDEIMEQWTEEECKAIYERFKACKAKLNFGSHWCPFCIKFKNQCNDCTYGVRHGICLSKTSDYQKYLEQFFTADLSKLEEFIKNS